MLPPPLRTNAVHAGRCRREQAPQRPHGRAGYRSTGTARRRVGPHERGVPLRVGARCLVDGIGHHVLLGARHQGG